MAQPIGRSGITRLSKEYNDGFRDALMIMSKNVDGLMIDLKHHHKRFTAKVFNEFVKCCLDNRLNLREHEDGFIRWNGVTNEFEFYLPK